MKNEEIKKLVAEIDLDQDGKICFVGNDWQMNE